MKPSPREKRCPARANTAASNYAMQIDPQFGETHFWLAECEMVQKEPHKAFSHLKKAVELDPELIPAQVKLAYFLRLAKQIDQAKDKLALVLSKEPDNPEARLLNSLILAGEGKTDQAEAELSALVAGGGEIKPKACLSLANILVKPNKLNEAEAILTGCLQGDEKNGILLQTFARVHTRL
jgi:predicted Zn-dependent protease